MRKLSLLFCMCLFLAFYGCKKEPAPAPQAKVEEAKPQEPAPQVEEKPAVKVEKKVAALPGTYTIQVASWETREDAQKLASFFENKGFQARVEEADVTSGRWYRVRIGKYDNYESAKEAADQIAEKYKSNIWLVRL
jgi:cell division protein FtsN